MVVKGSCMIVVIERDPVLDKREKVSKQCNIDR